MRPRYVWGSECGRGGAGRRKQLVALLYHTVREKYRAVPLPAAFARLLAKPREFLLSKVIPPPPPPFRHHIAGYLPSRHAPLWLLRCPTAWWRRPNAGEVPPCAPLLRCQKPCQLAERAFLARIGTTGSWAGASKRGAALSRRA